MEENAALKNCEYLIEVKVQKNLKTMWNNTLEIELGEAFSGLLDIVYNSRGLYNECPAGYRQGYESIQLREGKFKDPTHYMDNIIFNFGMIFDNVRDFVMWIQYGSAGENYGPYNSGFSLGNVVYFAFFKTDSKRRPG
mmetsp:Transcript_10139/g.8935  ORF Transcript_10139/g.8935 Transcript_10139/m.8935 type:complete len:138 (-) Transcript_10139:18-431(-)